MSANFPLLSSYCCVTRNCGQRCSRLSSERARKKSVYAADNSAVVVEGAGLKKPSRDQLSDFFFSQEKSNAPKPCTLTLAMAAHAIR